jgi:drug/metabolite transporter (DMT)-like permease
MRRLNSNFAIAASLLVTVLLWGGNNTGTRWLVQAWPPVGTGSTRFFCAGLLMVGLLHWTQWLGRPAHLSARQNHDLWWRSGLTLALYIICFNWALRFTSASHVALYLGASPVWALLWEERPRRSWRSAQRYGAAALALAGVAVLFWPALRNARTSLAGESMGLLCSVLWTAYGRQSRKAGETVPGAEVAAHSMWRAGVWLLPVTLVELLAGAKFHVASTQLAVQCYCIVAGGVVAFGFWNHALAVWPASRVMLFSNLLPLSTMVWAHFCLGEPVTRTFWLAMALIIAGVLLGQVRSLRAISESISTPSS